MRKIILSALALSLLAFSACKKDKDPTDNPDTGPKLRFKFVLDSTLARLDNLGNPEPIESGHAAQTPQFNLIGAHYIELAPTMYTALGTGTVLYVGEETTAGGSKALNF